MNLNDLFNGSVQLQDLRKSITRETELQEVLLHAQLAVNDFLATVGNILASDFVADTYLCFGAPFSTDTVKVFSVVAIVFNSVTQDQHSYVFPFRFVMVDSIGTPAGLYVYREN